MLTKLAIVLFSLLLSASVADAQWAFPGHSRTTGGTGCNTVGSLILKGDGAGGCANANSGSDYAPATSGTAILKGDNAGGFSAATAGTDYFAAISPTRGDIITAQGVSPAWARLAKGSQYQSLIMGASESAWGAVPLNQAAAVSGVLGVGNGGTGISALGTGVATALGINVGLAGAFVTFNGALGTPSSGTLTNGTGLPLSTGISGFGSGATSALAINTGSPGAFIVNGGALGTPSSGTLTNGTGLPISTGVSGLGTGVATALGVNVGSAGAPVLNGGVLGTPSSGTLTNTTGLPISSGVSGLGTGVATALGVNVGTAGAFVTNGGALGTPSSGTATNLTGTASGLTAGVATTTTAMTSGPGTPGAGSVSQVPQIYIDTTNHECYFGDAVSGNFIKCHANSAGYTLIQGNSGSAAPAAGGSTLNITGAASSMITTTAADGSPDSVSINSSVATGKLVGRTTAATGQFEAITPAGNLSMASGNLTDVAVKQIYIPASAMSSSGTCAATPITEEAILTNGPKRWVITPADDDTCSIEYDFGTPSTWNAGTVTVQLDAFSSANDSTKVLALDFAGQCVRSGDQVAAHSTTGEQSASVTFGNQTNDERISSASSAITLNGTCAAGAHVYMRGQVNATSTTSTVATNRILGVYVNLTY